MTRRPHRPASFWTWCNDCEHRGYHNRNDAKTVRKRHHGEKGMSVYACPHNDGMFHVGHRPEALSSGDIDRNLLRNQAVAAVAGKGI